MNFIQNNNFNMTNNRNKADFTSLVYRINQLPFYGVY